MGAIPLRALAWLVALIALGLAATSFALIAMTPGIDIVSDSWGFVGYDALFALLFMIVGLLVTSRRPDHPVGWLFLGSAILSGVQTLAESYSDYALPLGAPGGAEGHWVAGWIWLPAIGLIAITLMLFPNGRPASPAWRAVAIAIVPLSVIAGLLWAITPPTERQLPEAASGYAVVDPLGIGPDHPLRTVAALSIVALAGALIAAAASLRYRMSRGTGVERQQIKWVLYSSALVGPALVATVFTELAGPPFLVAKAVQFVAVAAVLFVPVSAAVAILRYRLYDIDVLINRTLVYGALSAMLLATYVVTIVVAQAALRPITGGSELAVAVSTLATLWLVQPLRRRIQRAVDQRFYRARYDASRTLDAFSTRLRDVVDLDAVRRDMLDVVGDTVQPAHASLWLKQADR